MVLLSILLLRHHWMTFIILDRTTYLLLYHDLKYINILKDLNIVCNNPEELAAKYLSNMKNFDDWWNSEKNFNQRKVFCENYAQGLPAFRPQ